jgi:hypothetical protein
MTKVYLVRYNDLDMDGIIQAFTSESEAERYVDLLMDEKEEDDFMIFYTSSVNLYNKCEEVENG